MDQTTQQAPQIITKEDIEKLIEKTQKYYKEAYKIEEKFIISKGMTRKNSMGIMYDYHNRRLKQLEQDKEIQELRKKMFKLYEKKYGYNPYIDQE